MSKPPHNEPGVPPRQDEPSGEDGINIRYIVAVGVVSLVIFAVSAVIAWWIMKVDIPKLSPAGRTPSPLVGKAEIGLIDTPMFDDDNRLAEWQAAKQKRLTSYGWADKAKGVVHIPIDQAMDMVVTQAASAPPPENRK